MKKYLSNPLNICALITIAIEIACIVCAIISKNYSSISYIVTAIIWCIILVINNIQLIDERKQNKNRWYLRAKNEDGSQDTFRTFNIINAKVHQPNSHRLVILINPIDRYCLGYYKDGDWLNLKGEKIEEPKWWQDLPELRFNDETIED